MESTVFSDTLAWIISHGYTILFLVMVVEGPAITAIGAFAAALGYFDLWWVFFLSILGNLLPDLIYYVLGFWGRRQFVDKYGHYLGIRKEKVERLEGLFQKHVGKTITLVKLIPALATPGLIMAGVLRVPIKPYIFWSLIVTIPSSGFYLFLGYFCEPAYEMIASYEKYGEYSVLGLIGIFVIVYFLRKKLSRKMAAKV
ncbi:MAG: DedA family protein [Chlamydiae bacterium]|nr:DedA family protein [Chlamydiota bacterium]